MAFALESGERIVLKERGSYGNASLNWMFALFSFGMAEVARQWTTLVVTASGAPPVTAEPEMPPALFTKRWTAAAYLLALPTFAITFATMLIARAEGPDSFSLAAVLPIVTLGLASIIFLSTMKWRSRISTNVLGFARRSLVREAWNVFRRPPLT